MNDVDIIGLKDEVDELLKYLNISRHSWNLSKNNHNRVEYALKIERGFKNENTSENR